MKASELRIGNLVKGASRGLPLKITAKILYHFDKLNVNPIPLTPEILEKAGFVYDIEFKSWESAKFDIWLHPVLNLNLFCFTGCPDGGKYLEFLHELQNLYYVLTGEELNIDL